MADLTEKERRELANAHRGEVIAGSGAFVEPKKLGSARWRPLCDRRESHSLVIWIANHGS